MGRDIIVVGASAGGVEVLVQLVRGLPADLPASVFIVLHVPPTGAGLLPRILERAGPLPVAHPCDGEPVERGRIYVAPPDLHMTLEGGVVRTVRGPRENHHRPAVDVLFRSAALAYGPRVVGVVLSGALDDGTAGLLAIKRRGGIAVVQFPEEAPFPDMPRNALRYAEVDHTLPVGEIARLLPRLAAQPTPPEGEYPAPKEMEMEHSIATNALAARPEEGYGQLTEFGCPECKGPLYEIRDGELLRFRCRVGHAYSSDTLVSDQAEALEAALWTAFNTLEESAKMARRIAAEARASNRARMAESFEERAESNARKAELLRRVLLQGEGAPAEAVAAEAS